MLQAVAEDDDDGQRCPELPSQTRTKERSLHLADSVSLPDQKAKPKASDKSTALSGINSNNGSISKVPNDMDHDQNDDGRQPTSPWLGWFHLGDRLSPS